MDRRMHCQIDRRRSSGTRAAPSDPMQPAKQHTVRIEPAKHVRVELGGKTIAETSNGFVSHETDLPDRYYFPRRDVHARISEGAGTGTCPWKGEWKHLDVDVDGKHVGNGGWTYYGPTPLGEPLRDHIAFYEDKFQIITE
jgi:uncharacterized protein (DUF427 family)